jgi:SAM-dependent methyltransferase
VLITLDPPYRVPEDADTFVFGGWAQVTDPAAPDIRFHLNGLEAPLVLTKRPGRLEEFFPGVDALAFYAQIDFMDLFDRLPPDRLVEPFLLEATITTEGVARTFEYAVTDAWLRRLSGLPLRARPMPPEHLQIRVSGAAAGQFHATGRRAARQLEGLLRQAGQPLRHTCAILDFGCGPGRLISALRELHPGARYFGSDIDPEAIAWAQAELSDLAHFLVNPAEPPIPLPDASFDLVYAISVFTHLPEDLQHAWLADLRRVLKPGGVLLTTKMNPAAYRDLPAQVRAQGRANGFAYWEGAAETDGLPDFYRLAYHTEDYVRREWGRYFEVLHVGSHDLNDTQDAVVLRKPNPWRGRLACLLGKAAA